MTLKSELNQLLNPTKDQLKGSLGISPSVIKVTNRPGFVWVRMFDNPNEIVPVHNSKVSPTYDLPVLLSFNGKKYEIESVDTDRYGSWPTDSSFVADHGPRHSARRGHEGGDIVWVDTQQFMPLLVVPASVTGSHDVQINSAPYLDGDGNWSNAGGTGVYNLLPISNTDANMYLLVMDDDTKGFYCITGSTFSATLSGTSDIMTHVPQFFDPADVPLAAIKATPNAPIAWKDIYDVRQFVKSKGTGGASGTGIGEDYICMRDEKTSGTTGGTPTTGWNVHTINKEISDIGNHCTLIGTDTLRLDPGTYRFSIVALAFSSNNTQLRLKDVSNGVIADSEGLSAWARNAVSDGTTVETKGVFSIPVQSDIQIEQYFDNAVSDGFGLATNSGQKEIYCIVELWKMG